MAEIRIKSGIDVKVNDQGDTIKIRTDDAVFIQGFYDLVDTIQNIKNNLQGEMEGKSEREKISVTIKHNREVMNGIDALFGDETCRKVFGDIVPSTYLLADFFHQLIPIVEQYANERKKEIEKKYNNNRRGAAGKKHYRNKKELIQGTAK